MTSSTRTDSRTFFKTGLALIAFLFAFASTAAVQAQQARADIQLGATGNTRDDRVTSIEADPGATVTVELFGTGYSGSFGLVANFTVDNPSAIASGQAVQGTKTDGYPFDVVLGGGFARTETGFRIEIGTLNAPQETGEGLKFVGAFNLTLASAFTTVNLTLTSLSYAGLTADPATPNQILTIINPASTPRTFQADLDPDPGNLHQTFGRYNPGERVTVQLFGSGLRKLVAYEVHARVDTPAIDIRNTQFIARAPFSVTTAGGGTALPPTAPSASSRAGADIQLPTPGGLGNGAYSPSALQVTARPGDRVALEVYGTGFTDVSAFTARFWFDNLAAVRSVSAVPSTLFRINLPGATRIESDQNGNRAVLTLGVLGQVSSADPQPQLLGTLIITLSPEFNGLSLNLRTVRFLGATEEVVTTSQVLNIQPAGGVQAPTVEVQGNTVVAKASITGTDSARGNNVRLGRMLFLPGPRFRGAKITITRVVFTPRGAEPVTLEPNEVLDLRSFVTDAPLVTEPPVPITVSDTRALIRWVTNKPSSSLVLYDTSAVNLDKSEGIDELVREHLVLIEGLNLNTRYFFQVVSVDDQGRESVPFPPRPASFVTRRFPDNQATRILKGPASFGTTTDGTNIVLELDEAARVDVLYGTAEDALDQTESVTSTQLVQRVPLRGLTQGTTYFYQVRVTDLNGNTQTTQRTFSFTTLNTADNVAPRILGRPSLLGRSFNGGVVAWASSEPGNSAVFYSLIKSNVDAVGQSLVAAGKQATVVAALDSAVVDESVVQHRVALSNLLADTTYYGKVRTTDASGNSGFSPTFSFNTLANEDSVAAFIVRPPVLPRRSDTEVLIVLELNEPAIVEVQYDTTTAIYSDEDGTAGETVTSAAPVRRQEIRLTNLTPARRYYYKLKTTDLAGNVRTDAVQRSFVTRLVASTDPPVVFSRPVARGITPKSAIISWGADKPHSAVIRLRKVVAGKQADGGAFTDVVEDIEFSRRHDVTVPVEPGSYEYEVETIDADGNSSTTRNLSFFVPTNDDSTAPTITRGPVVRNITATTATIDWFLNEPGDARVSYGLTTSYTEFVEDPTMSVSKSVTLVGLTPETVYHYAVGSADQSNNIVTTTASGTVFGVSADHTFRTASLTAPPRPVFLEGPLVEFTDKIAIVKWKTDQLSTSRVVIGVPPGTTGVPDGTPVFGDPTTELVFESNDLVTDHAVTITNLSGGLPYFFQASSTNEADSTTFSRDPTVSPKLQPPGGFGVFTTSTQSDSQFPVITGGPKVIASTTTTLTIEWETDESSNSTVSFGTAADALNAQEVDGTNVTTHRTVLANLSPGTTYAYKVASTDASGNGATESQTAFGTTPSTVDITAPAITSAPEIIYKTDRSATVRWTTSEASDAQVSYGTSQSSLNQILSDPDFGTEHSMTLTNLEPSTTYFLRAASKDQNNNGPVQSSVIEFTTDGQPDNTAPSVSNVVVSPGDRTAIVTWETNELSDSAVKFGPSGGSLDFNKGDATDVLRHSVTLTNLDPSTEYTLLVESIDRSGNGPTQSSPVTFTTFAEGETPRPNPPAKPTATEGNGTVRLAWEASSSAGVIGYIVERAPEGGDFSPIANLDAVTAYVDGTVENGATYTYRVISLGAGQLSGDPSEASDAVTPAAAKGPAAPTFSHVQGSGSKPTVVVNNSTTPGTLTYSFQLSSSAEFTDALVVKSGVAAGAGTGGSDPSGFTAFTVDRALTDGVTYHYRVNVSDGTFESAFLTGSFTVDADALEFPGDLTGDFSVNLADFIRFVQSFNKKTGDAAFNNLADITRDGQVNLADFIQFVQAFNRKYVQGESSSKPVAPTVLTYGIDARSRLGLVALPVSSESGAILPVDVMLSEAADLKGFALRIHYDPEVLRFASATDGKENLLTQQGQLAEIFGTLSHDPEKGEVLIAGAITYGEAAEGDGRIARLRFRLLREHPRGGLVNIAEGILIDGRFNPATVQNLGGRLSLVPDEFALERNYPNPFNPETTIRYAVPEAGKVTIRIYNVLGQEVRTLVRGEHQAGYYAVRWDGKDRLGRSVASGVYLYRMEAANFTQVHKMLLLK